MLFYEIIYSLRINTLWLLSISSTFSWLPLLSKLLPFFSLFTAILHYLVEYLCLILSISGSTYLPSVSNDRESNIWLSLGGFQEKGPDDNHVCNTHVLVDDSGKIRNAYRKIHL